MGFRKGSKGQYILSSFNTSGVWCQIWGWSLTSTRDPETQTDSNTLHPESLAGSTCFRTQPPSLPWAQKPVLSIGSQVSYTSLQISHQVWVLMSPPQVKQSFPQLTRNTSRLDLLVYYKRHNPDTAKWKDAQGKVLETMAFPLLPRTTFQVPLHV